MTAVRTTDQSGWFRRGRQFGALSCLAVALLAANDRVPPHATTIGGVPGRFALYGAAYSAALAFSVRGPATWRRVLFILLGALLSAANVEFGLMALRLAHTPPGSRASVGLLVGVAGIGAVAYALLLRLVCVPRLPLAALPSTGGACMLAALAVFALQAATRSGGAWLAVAWWFAFSLALWYQENHSTRHRRSAHVRNP